VTDVATDTDALVRVLAEAMAVATALNQTPDVFSVSVETRKVVYAPELNNDLFQNSVTL
jgi:hypothetical protein